MARVPQDAIDEIANDLRALPGIRAVPEVPPDSINHFPFVVVYDGGGGVWEAGNPAGEKRWIGSIVIELHVGRIDLPHDFENAQRWSEVIPNTLLKSIGTTSGDRFNSTIDTFIRLVTSHFGALGWDAVETFGYRWTMEGVKIRSAIT